jgi:hypothetical protein
MVNKMTRELPQPCERVMENCPVIRVLINVTVCCENAKGNCGNMSRNVLQTVGGIEKKAISAHSTAEIVNSSMTRGPEVKITISYI